MDFHPADHVSFVTSHTPQCIHNVCSCSSYSNKNNINNIIISSGSSSRRRCSDMQAAAAAAEEAASVLGLDKCWTVVPYAAAAATQEGVAAAGKEGGAAAAPPREGAAAASPTREGAAAAAAPEEGAAAAAAPEEEAAAAAPEGAAGAATAAPARAAAAAASVVRLFPPHCVQGTKGARLHKAIKTRVGDLVIRKGILPHAECFSACGNDEEPTGLINLLKKKGIEVIAVCGFCLEFCVAESAVVLSAAGCFRRVVVLTDMTAAINENKKEETISYLRSNNIICCTFEEFIKNKFYSTNTHNGDALNAEQLKTT